jgi:hypothetical protein
MKELADRYHLRLTARFGFYDTLRSQQWHEWQHGEVVTDHSLIEWLQSLHAPVQRIETEFKR